MYISKATTTTIKIVIPMVTFFAKIQIFNLFANSFVWAGWVGKERSQRGRGMGEEE